MISGSIFINLNSQLYNRILEFNKLTNIQSNLQDKIVFVLSLNHKIMEFLHFKNTLMTISSFYHSIFLKSSCLLINLQIKEPLRRSTWPSARILVFFKNSEATILFLLHIITRSTSTLAESKIQGTPQILQLAKKGNN